MIKAGAALAAALLLAGCGVKTPTEQKTQAATEPRNPLEVTPSEDLLKQLKIGEAKYAAVAASLRIPGRIEADETRLAVVGAPMTARIVEMEVIEGQNVKRGQVLATLYSTELSDAQFNFLKAFSQQTLAQRAAERAKQLLAADVIGSAELQRRETELSQSNAEVSALRDQLKVLGMNADEIQKLEKTRVVNSRSEIVAQIDGTVLERRVTIGQVLQPAETAFILADLSSVWLVADVPEQVAGAIAVGKLVEAEVPALPGHPIRGKLSFVSATVNPETRTVTTRIDLPNPHRRFKPAMLATVILKDNAENARVIPSSAIVREGNDELVFAQTAPGAFILRPVTLGAEVDGNRVVTAGISAGEKVVLDGAFHLNNERKRMALQGK
jgi:cobalt-zinc-cadmium efflux system membrane fusion protein